MDLTVNLAPSYRDLKDPTTRQNFDDTVEQKRVIDLRACHISDIGENLSVEPFVYIDDTKAIKKIHSEDDVEKLQEDISKLHDWGKRNNMEFNNKKFVVLRYGKNIEIKENTSYFSGETDEIIEEKESTRDLGII